MNKPRRNRKSLDAFKAWLELHKEFTVCKYKSHDKKIPVLIEVRQEFIGDCYFTKHPYSGLDCLTAGKGMFDLRLWTSEVFSAKKLKHEWRVTTQNSIYIIEATCCKNKNQ